MDIGVPKEIKRHEYRVAVTPHGVSALIKEGHRVLCEHGLGLGSDFSDSLYEQAGATITGKESLFAESELIVKVKEPLPEEFGLFRDGQAVFTFLHLAPNRRLTEMLLKKRITGLAYETLEEGRGLPLLAPMSEIAGRAAPLVGACFLQKPMGGRGVLPTGATGVPPARATVIGAGTVGANAVRVAHAMGMEVTVLNKGEEKLRAIDELYGGKVRTLLSSKEAISESIADADMVVGAVYVRGARVPVLITREMLKTMNKGSVVVDVSIDQGGCLETSRPTTHDEPVYKEEGVIHYCVANIPGAYPRTSTLALTNATLPYLIKLAATGIIKAATGDGPLGTALNTYEGKITHKGLAGSAGLGPRP